MRRLTILAVLLVAANVASAGTATESVVNPQLKKKLEEFEKTFGNLWSIRWEEGQNRIATLSGTLSTRIESTAVQEILAKAAKLAGADPADFTPPVVTALGSAQQYRFQQIYRDPVTHAQKPVDNSFIVINLADRVYDITVNVAREQEPFRAIRTPESAKKLALGTLMDELGQEKNEQDRSLLERFHSVLEASASIQDSSALTKPDGQIERVFRVRVEAFVVQNGCRSRLTVREYDIDATTLSNDIDSAVLRRRKLLQAACHAPISVFDPNPVNTLNNDSPTANDIAAAFETRSIELESAGTDGFELTSHAVRICQIEGPETDPPFLTPQATTPIAYPRNSAELAALMVYYHVTEFQKHLATLDFKSLVRQLEADVDAEQISNTEAYSRYLDDPEGMGYLAFGRSSERFFAEDAELIAHEYAHAILFQTTRRRFTIIRDPNAAKDSEAGPISEGFADYWALSSFLRQTLAHGHKPACFAEWVRGGPCTRCATALPSHDSFVEGRDDHVNGQIWSGVLFQILRDLGDDRSIADRIILLGHLLRAFDGPAPTMQSIAEGIVIADAKEFGGAHKDTLCAAFDDHAIRGLQCCTPGGCPGLVASAPQLTQPVESVPALEECIPRTQ